MTTTPGPTTTGPTTTGPTMRAWQASGDGTLRATDLAIPVPSAGEVLVEVLACGVCRTDLHVVDGELPPHRSAVVPGHEVVGRVVRGVGDTAGLVEGDVVGIPWLRGTCGSCHWCRSGRENLCERSTYTGWDADGGYAELAVAPAAYAYRLPAGLAPTQAAPLLCAGIIGYRSLKRAQLPPGGRLGLFGFGASAHLTAQIALAQGAEVHVVSRGAGALELALDLGATTATADVSQVPPLDAAIVFAPAGEVARDALAALAPSGTLALAGIYMTDIPALSYERHLFRERTVTTVTSNTRADGEEFLRLAGRLDLHASVTTYRLDRADEAVADLRADRLKGVAVLDLTRG